MEPDRIIHGCFLFLLGSFISLLGKVLDDSNDLAQRFSTFAVIIVKTVELDLQSFEIKALSDGILQVADKIFFHSALNFHASILFLEITVAGALEIDLGDLLGIDLKAHILDILVEGLESLGLKEVCIFDYFFHSILVHGDMSSFIN